MNSPKVRTATRDDEAAVVSVVLLAFIGDPFARWIFPDAAKYVTVSPQLTRAFGGNGFDHGAVDVVGETVSGAAMWLPPGVEPDGETMQAIIAEHAPPDVLAAMEGILAGMAAAHPEEPCWYLPILGVDPSLHSWGLGSALLRHATERADAAGLPAYLESSNPRNIDLYERHGFVAMETIQVGSSPPLVPMLRRPR